MTWSIRLGPIYSRQNKSTATVGWLYIVLVILANISENMCLLRHSKTTTYMFITVYSIVKRKGFCLFRRWEIQIRPDIIHCSGFSSVIVHTVISYKSFELLTLNVLPTINDEEKGIVQPKMKILSFTHTLVLLKTCMTLFLLWNMIEVILKN